MNKQSLMIVLGLQVSFPLRKGQGLLKCCPPAWPHNRLLRPAMISCPKAEAVPDAGASGLG